MPRKLSKEQIENNITKRCLEMKYTVTKPIIYKNSYSKISLKCNKDGYEWTPTYSNFIYNKKGCPKCNGGVRIFSDNKIYQMINDKCKKYNYTIIEEFDYKNAHSKIHLKCNIDGHEWKVSYNDFINKKDTKCGKCSNKIALTQEEAISNIIKRCNELNISMIKKFKYKKSTSKIHLKCNIDGYEWYMIYNNFINKKYGCPKCAGIAKLHQEETENKVNNRCKELQYTLTKPFIYVNNKTRIHLKCDIDGFEWSVRYSHFINSKSGCPICRYEKSFNTMIERYGEAYLKYVPKYNPHTIQFIDDLSELTGINFNHAVNGGEKKFHKYWVDGYNEDYNIVLEFDEKHHNLQKEKDEERQQYIEDNFGCTFIRIDWEQFINNTEEEIGLLVEKIELFKG